jgi:hypothetical protein
MKILNYLGFVVVLLAISSSGLVADGVTYELMQGPGAGSDQKMYRAGTNQKMHVVTIDPKKTHSLRIVPAVGDVCSREELTTMGLRHKPTVGVNVGGFRRGGRYDGCPRGLLIIDSFIRSDAGLFQPVLLIDSEEKTIEIKNQKLDWAVVIDDKVIPVDRINQPAGDDEVVLYNTFFGRETRTSPLGVELVIERGRLVQIWSSWGNAGIPRQGYVVRIGAKHPLAQNNWGLYLNKACLSPRTNSIDLNRDSVFAVQGQFMLVEHGQVLNNWMEQFQSKGSSPVLADELAGNCYGDQLDCEYFLKYGSAYTVLGLTAEGLLKIIVIERGDDFNTLQDIAQAAKDLGCVTAMLAGSEGDVGLWVNNKLATNFDGGYDRMYRKLETLERPISSALLAFEYAFAEE